MAEQCFSRLTLCNKKCSSIYTITYLSLGSRVRSFGTGFPITHSPSCTTSPLARVYFPRPCVRPCHCPS